MRVVAIALLLAGACSRSPLGDPGDVAPDDDAPSDPGEVSLCGVPRSAWVWGVPTLVTELETKLDAIATNPDYTVYDPTLSEDGLTLYLSSDATGDFDTYELYRPSLGAAYAALDVLGADVNPPGVISYGYQRFDSLGIVLAFGNYDVPGNAGRALRFVLGDAAASPVVWSAPPAALIREDQFDARMTATGRTIILASRVAATGLRQIYLTTRATRADQFETVGAITGVATDIEVSAPWLSADERLLFYARDVYDLTDIWVADRDDSTAAFGNAAPLTSVNGERFDGEPFVFTNGAACELYFVSNRGDPNSLRLYRSRLL